MKQLVSKQSARRWCQLGGILLLCAGCTGAAPGNGANSSGNGNTPPSMTMAPGPGMSTAPGSTTSPDGTTVVPPTPTAADALGPVALRRLTAAEYRNSVQAVLGLAQPPSGTLAAEAIGKNGFDNFGSALNVDGTLAGQYAAIAADAAKVFTVSTCDAPKAAADCAASFLQDFGKRAFRRPLTTEEIQQYQKLFSDALAATNYERATRQLVETLLQSPKFLYRFELGQSVNGATRTLTSYEVASELSYLFTSSPPDPMLMAAADANGLQSATQIETEARRLLKRPTAKDSFRHLLRIYGGLLRFDGLAKDTTVYPEYTPELRAAMSDSTDQFIDSVLWEGPGDFNTLFTAPYAYVNTALAGLYGVPDPGQSTLAKQMLNPLERSGLLTEPSVLASHSKPFESFPIARGKFVRVGLLCENLPAPPAVVPETPAPDPTLTTRERFARHSSDPACAGCHQLIDPIGFGLENYDGIGKYRTTENNKPVDSSGNITGTLDINGPYSGGVELSAKLAGSAEAKECLTTKAFQWAFGRDAGTGEQAAVTGISTKLAPAGLDIREVVVALTQTDAFLFRTFE